MYESATVWRTPREIRRMQVGTATTIESVAVALSTATWYWFRVQAFGNRITAWISTTGLVGSWVNQIRAVDSVFSTGAIGIRGVSLATEFQSPSVYTGVTPAIPVRPGVGATLLGGQEVFVERVNFNSQDLLVDMARVI